MCKYVEVDCDYCDGTGIMECVDRDGYYEIYCDYCYDSLGKVDKCKECVNENEWVIKRNLDRIFYVCYFFINLYSLVKGEYNETKRRYHYEKQS